MRLWNPVRDARLIAFAEAGGTTVTAAAEFGCTPMQASNRLRDLRRQGKTTAQFGVSNAWPEDADARLIAGIRAGKSSQQIAKQEGRSPQAVYRRAAKLKADGLTNGFPPPAGRAPNPDGKPSKFSKRWLAERDGALGVDIVSDWKQRCDRHLHDLNRAYDDGHEDWPECVPDDLDRGGPALRISYIRSHDMAGPGGFW